MTEALGKLVLTAAMARRLCFVMAATPRQEETERGCVTAAGRDRDEPVVAWARGRGRRERGSSEAARRCRQRLDKAHGEEGHGGDDDEDWERRRWVEATAVAQPKAGGGGKAVEGRPKEAGGDYEAVD